MRVVKDVKLLTDSQCCVPPQRSGWLSQLRTGTFEGKLLQLDSEAYTMDPTVTLLDSVPMGSQPLHQPPPTSLLIGLEVNPILLDGI